MPPVRLYEVMSHREDKPQYKTVYEFKSAQAVAEWLNDQLKLQHLKKYHIVNYMNGACENKHYNALSIALDSYKISSKKVKAFPKDFINGRVQQSKVM